MNIVKNNKYILFYILSFLVAGIYIFLSMIAIPVGSDPGRIWYFSKIFLDGNLESAFRTLEPFLAVAINALFLGTFGTWFPLTSIQGMSSALTVLLVSSYIFKNYGIKPALISLLLFLSSYIFLDRSADLVPYPLFTFLVTLGMLLFIKYQETYKDVYIYLSSVLISISIFIFNLPISSLMVFFLFYFFSFFDNHRDKITSILKPLIKFYSLSFILLAPWFIWRFSRAGMDFYKNPIHWLGQKYWSKFNILLWDRPKPLTLEYFDYFLTVGVRNLMGPLLFLSFAWFGLYKVRRPLFYVFWILAPILPIILGKLPTEARYLYPILPPLIILASVGFNEILNILGESKKTFATFLFVATCFVTIINNFQSYSDVHYSNKNVATEVLTLRKNYFHSEDIIFFRSLQFQGLLPDNPMISPQYMEEEDAVAIVRWTSPEAVQNVVEKYKINWVLLYKDNKLEEEFGGWIKFVSPEFAPRHYIEITKSNMFVRREESRNFVLYQYTNQ